MKIPKAIQNLIESFEKLPGIGPKTAQRLTFYLLHVPQYELDKFASSLTQLKTGTVICSNCFTVGETDPCEICEDESRDQGMICVVEEPLDVLALEKNGKYKGVYHVLHGRIDPLNNIGPDEIYIKQLLDRVRQGSTTGITGTTGSTIKEVILATNPTMEGEATAMYIAKRLREQLAISNLPRGKAGKQLAISRIGRGLPTGADLEYADEVTLQRAMEGRSEI